MSSRHYITTSIAAMIGTAVLAATPTISSAETPAGWEICPAIDTDPMCDVVAQATDGGGRKTGRHGRRLPPDRPPTAGDVAACSRPNPDEVPDVERTDIPDCGCDDWRNPVIACPGLDETDESVDIADYSCLERTYPIIACPV